MKIKNIKGFTLAEVLVTLVIIGIIAAILFPSIMANYTERTFKAKRQALFGRMSQAMAEMGDQFGNYEVVKNAEGKTTCSINSLDCVDDGSTLKFLTEGFSQVYKIAATCDADSLSACDIPEEVTRTDGTTFSLKDAKTFTKYNPKIKIANGYLDYDTTAAGFITKNGESIMMYFNPKCTAKRYNDLGFATETKICVNMIYDLNGAKKKPNRVGEDIGFMSVFYVDAPYVTSTKVFDYNAVPDYSSTKSDNPADTHEYTTIFKYNYTEAQSACHAFGNDIVLPSLEDAMSIQINAPLIQDLSEQKVGNWAWTGSYASPDWVWIVYLRNGTNDNDKGLDVMTPEYASGTRNQYIVRCVYGNNN